MLTARLEDAKSIEALLAALCAAWGSADAGAYAACFTPDSEYVTFNGMLLRGREENATLHDALFRSVLKGTRISVTVETLAFLFDEVALVRTFGRGRQPSRQTFVMVRHEGQWRIRSFQNTRVQLFSIWLTRLTQRRFSKAVAKR